MGMWKELVDAGYFVDNANADDWTDAADKVARGEAAMTLMGTWITGYWNGNGLKPGDDYDFFEFPTITDGVPNAVGRPGRRPGDLRQCRQPGGRRAAPRLPGLRRRGAGATGRTIQGALSANVKVDPASYTPVMQKALDDVTGGRGLRLQLRPRHAAAGRRSRPLHVHPVHGRSVASVEALLDETQTAAADGLQAVSDPRHGRPVTGVLMCQAGRIAGSSAFTGDDDRHGTATAELLADPCLLALPLAVFGAVRGLAAAQFVLLQRSPTGTASTRTTASSASTTSPRSSRDQLFFKRDHQHRDLDRRGDRPAHCASGLAWRCCSTRGLPARSVFKSIFYLPICLSAVIVGQIWIWIYQPDWGLLNTADQHRHRRAQFNFAWLAKPGTALYSVIVAWSWQQTGLAMVIFLAGPHRDPAPTSWRSADIEGAKRWQTHPACRPAAAAPGHRGGGRAVGHQLAEGLRHPLHHDRRRAVQQLRHARHAHVQRVLQEIPDGLWQRHFRRAVPDRAGDDLPLLPPAAEGGPRSMTDVALGATRDVQPVAARRSSSASSCWPCCSWLPTVGVLLSLFKTTRDIALGELWSLPARPLSRQLRRGARPTRPSQSTSSTRC